MKGYALVVLAALLWSSLGCFYKDLILSYGISTLSIAFFRAALSSVFLMVVALVFRPKLLAIEWRDVLLLKGFGLFGVAGFFMSYVFAVDRAGVGIAAILMYTAPIWITFISRQFLGETISKRRWLALGLTFLGCTLVVDLYHLELLRTNAAGIIWGLAAGLGYALFCVFNKVSVKRLSPWTVLLYGMSLGALVMLPLQSMGEVVHVLQTPPVLLRLLAVALFATLGSGFAFATGLKYVPVSSAGVVANLEPLSAVVLAFLVFGEVMTGGQLLGGGLIIIGAILSTRS